MPYCKLQTNTVCTQWCGRLDIFLWQIEINEIPRDLIESKETWVLQMGWQCILSLHLNETRCSPESWDKLFIAAPSSWMVMHVASRACLHVWQNRSHITLCIQTSHRHCLIEHTLQWCQVALKLLWIQGLSWIWWMGCVLTPAMNNIFGPCSCRRYNELFGNCACPHPPPPSLSAMVNSGWKQQTPPSNWRASPLHVWCNKGRQATPSPKGTAGQHKGEHDLWP